MSINLTLLRINRDKHTEISFYPRYLDTVRLAQQFLPRNRKYNLEVLLEYFGWQNRKKHRAFADAVGSYVLLQELLTLARAGRTGCPTSWLAGWTGTRPYLLETHDKFLKIRELSRKYLPIVRIYKEFCAEIRRKCIY